MPQEIIPGGERYPAPGAEDDVSTETIEIWADERNISRGGHHRGGTILETFALSDKDTALTNLREALLKDNRVAEILGNDGGPQTKWWVNPAIIAGVLVLLGFMLFYAKDWSIVRPFRGPAAAASVPDRKDDGWRGWPWNWL